MKQFQYLMIILTVVSGCNVESTVMTNLEQKTWCNAQFNDVFVKGHFSNITNLETGEFVNNCCCMGFDEFICLCAGKTKEINNLFN